jgi:hypothetical protein
MIMDRTGTSIYFGSSRELMIYSTASNTKAAELPNLPGLVLAVSPTNSQLLINDQKRKAFYLASSTGSILGTFGGLGTAAQWTPDGKTLYVTDSADANKLPANIAAGITGHTDTLYVYNANTGWTTYPLTTSGGTSGPQNLAITVPGVGAFLSGSPTVAHTWCPTDTPTRTYYPQGASVSTDTQVLTATADGMHILGAAAESSPGAGPISFSDIGVTIPSTECPGATTGTLAPLTIPSTLNPLQTVNVSATAVNGIVTSPAAVKQGVSVAGNSLSFILYNGSSTDAKLPYYTQSTGDNSGPGTLGYLTLTGASAITAPVAGAFSADSTLFFVSTSGDNQIHYIDTSTLKDTQQISPNLPACTPGADPGCTITGTAPSVVPATAIFVKPRSTT